MTNETARQKFVRVLAENPDVPIKARVNEDIEDDVITDGWYPGEIYDCRITEYVVYEYTTWFYFDIARSDLFEAVRDEIWRRYYRRLCDVFKESKNMNFTRTGMAGRFIGEILPEDKLNQLAWDEIEALDWKPCILIDVRA